MAGKAQKVKSRKGLIAAETFAGDPGAPAPRKGGNPNLGSLPRDPATGQVLSKVPLETDTKAAKNPRQSILDAFGRLGGTRWLVKLAKKYPKDFASLLAKAMPQELSVTGTFGYTALVVPVEQRDAIPGECSDITPLAIPMPAPPEELDPFA